MSQTTLAWAAFKNMLREAAQNPRWAFISLLAAPFRLAKPLFQGFLVLLLILFVVGLGGQALLREYGFGPGSMPLIGWYLVTLLIMLAVAFYFLTQPLIFHFGNLENDTHGSGIE